LESRTLTGDPVRGISISGRSNRKLPCVPRRSFYPHWL
jgi:hypothetical protein